LLAKKIEQFSISGCGALHNIILLLNSYENQHNDYEELQHGKPSFCAQCDKNTFYFGEFN